MAGDLIVGIVLLVASASAPLVERELDPAQAAFARLEDVLRGDFARVEATFDERLRAALPAGALERTWRGLARELGAYRRHGDPTVTRTETVSLVEVPVQFERAAVAVRFAFDASGRLAGLRVLRSQSAAGAAVPSHRPSWPPYARPDAFTEREVTAGAEGWPLPATLTLPAGDGPFPAVVLVHGSGPHDRDETVGGVKPFRDLAWGLASRGIAVLRYEKRTRVHAERFASRPEGVTLDAEVVADATAGVALLGSMARVDPRRIFVLGHSLGAMLLPRVAARAPRVAGLVSLAAGTRSLDRMMLDQAEHLERLGGSAAEEARGLRMEVERLRQAVAGAPADAHILGAPVSYWREALALDPRSEFARTKQPLLFLQGERDYQTTLADLSALKRSLAGRSDAAFRSYPRLDHLFVAGDGPSSPSEYGRPAHIAPEVIDDVAAFVVRQRQ